MSLEIYSDAEFSISAMYSRKSAITFDGELEFNDAEEFIKSFNLDADWCMKHFKNDIIKNHLEDILENVEEDKLLDYISETTLLVTARNIKLEKIITNNI